MTGQSEFGIYRPAQNSADFLAIRLDRQPERCDQNCLRRLIPNALLHGFDIKYCLNPRHKAASNMYAETKK
jgi:hypothetical protein